MLRNVENDREASLFEVIRHSEISVHKDGEAAGGTDYTFIAFRIIIECVYSHVLDVISVQKIRTAILRTMLRMISS